jgi:hypothetical protein
MRTKARGHSLERTDALGAVFRSSVGLSRKRRLSDVER